MLFRFLLMENGNTRIGEKKMYVFSDVLDNIYLPMGG